MNKEEILNKYGVALENFNPAPNATIKINIDQNKIDLDVAAKIAEIVHELYPEHGIFTTFKGIDVK